MGRYNGGVLGVDNTPTQDDASGIWSLRDVYKAEAGDEWPFPVPTAPTTVTAEAGDEEATVTFSGQVTYGDSPTFTVTSSPDGITATGSSPVTVTGLTNGTEYTFTVTVTDNGGQTATSSASNAITPVATPALLTYTMSQSSVYSQNVAATYANMTDDNYLNTDATGTNNGSNEYVRCDLGSVKTVTEIRIAPAHSGLTGGWSEAYTESETVRYSDDAINWTTAYTLPSSMSVGQLDTTQVNFTARYVEVNTLASNDYLALCEFQVIGY